MHNKVVAAVAGLGVLLLATGTVLICFAYPALLREQVINAVVIRDGSEAYARFQRIPLPMFFKVYLFNVTNPDDVSNGARPILKEVGPYHYDLISEHVNIIDQPEDETLLSQRKTTYFFNQEKSGNLSDSDELTVLNMALLGTALKVKREMPSFVSILNPVLKEIFPHHESAFITTSVRNYLFDGDVVINCSRQNLSVSSEMVCSQIQNPKSLPRTIREDGKGIYKFAMFNYKNGSLEWYTTKRGITNSSDVGRILEWRNKTTLSYWGASTCNMINGTDSTVYPPFPKTSDAIYIFSEEICRSVHAFYDRRVVVNGIPALHYSGYKNIFANQTTEPANECFCITKKCLENGAIDLHKCHGVPVVASLPHFYEGSDTYKNYSIGLEPKKELHETYIELEENGGLPMQGSKRVQLNMFLTKFPQVDAFKKVSEGLFPAIWVDEGVTLDGEPLALLKTMYNKLNVLGTLKWVIVAVGIAALTCALSLYFGNDKDDACYPCFGAHQSNRITDVSPKNELSVNTIGVLFRKDTSNTQ